MNEDEFGIIALTTDEMRLLSPDERDFVLAASFITNDLRFFWSLMARSPIDAQDDDVRSLQLVRWLWASRKLASAIVEAIDTIDYFRGRLDALKAVGTVISRDLRGGQLAKTARLLRNKTAHHFAKDGLSECLRKFRPSDKHRIIAHAQQGNSISEIGEQIFTLPLISDEEAGLNSRQFDEWCKNCSGQLMGFCNKAVVNILGQSFPGKIFEKRVLKLGAEVDSLEHRWPLFLYLPSSNFQNSAEETPG